MGVAVVLAALILVYPLWRIGTNMRSVAWNLKCIGEDLRKQDLLQKIQE